MIRSTKGKLFVCILTLATATSIIFIRSASPQTASARETAFNKLNPQTTPSHREEQVTTCFPDSVLPNKNQFQGSEFHEDNETMLQTAATDIGALRALTSECRSSRPLEEEIQKMNAYWQVVDEAGTYIAMYSAFYDTRPLENGTASAHVLINAVAKQLSRRRSEEKIGTVVRSQFYCQIWYDKLARPVPVRMAFVRNEFLRPIDGVMYSTYMLVCPLPSAEVVPGHVSVTRSRCERAETYLPVSDRRRDDPLHEFGICTAVGFGRLPPEHMVEWFEFHRLLGVTEFNIYSVGMRGLRAVFDHYGRTGALRVHPTTSPLSSSYVASIRLASQVVLNHCMLSNQNRYRFVVIVDFDEVMWPNSPANFSTLIRRIERSQNVHRPVVRYAFQNAYHILSHPEDRSQPWYLRTMRFRYRQPPTPMPHKYKSIINPRKCIIVYHHDCVLPVSDPELGQPVVVDPSVAVSHHYRQCPQEATDCDVIPQHPDDLVLRYKDNLDRNVRYVLTKLRLL